MKEVNKRKEYGGPKKTSGCGPEEALRRRQENAVDGIVLKLLQTIKGSVDNPVLFPAPFYLHRLDVM